MASYTEDQVRKAMEQAAEMGERYTFRRPSSMFGDAVMGEFTSRRGDLFDMIHETIANLRREVPHA